MIRMEKGLAKKENPKPKKGEGQKEKIVRTAIKKFSKEGFSNTSMDEIAKESKVSKGLLFYHFNNKEELYVQALAQGIDSTLDFADKLTEIAEAGLFQKKEKLYQDLEKILRSCCNKEREGLGKIMAGRNAGSQEEFQIKANSNRARRKTDGGWC